MEIEKKETESGLEFSITGALSGTKNSTISLFETISREVDNKPEEIVIDIKSATYVDSMSIGLLVGILLKCREKEVKFRFINVPEHIRKAFDTTHLVSVFPDFY